MCGRSLPRLVLAALLVTGCAATAPLTREPIATTPDQPAPAVPTLPPLAGAAGGEAPPAPADTGPAPPPPPPPPPEGSVELPAVPIDVPDDVPEALGPLYTLVAVMTDDPDRAGERGSDLLDELRRVLDKPQRSRISRALDRLEEWTEEGEIDGEVAVAARDALRRAHDAAVEDSDDDSDEEKGNGRGNGNGDGDDD